MKALSFTVAALMTFTLASADEQPRHARILADKPGLATVFDDDGGKVEIFRHGEAGRTLEFHGGAVVHEPLVQLVFLGAQWRQPAPGATDQTSCSNRNTKRRNRTTSRQLQDKVGGVTPAGLSLDQGAS